MVALRIKESKPRIRLTRELVWWNSEISSFGPMFSPMYPIPMVGSGAAKPPRSAPHVQGSDAGHGAGGRPLMGITVACIPVARPWVALPFYAPASAATTIIDWPMLTVGGVARTASDLDPQPLAQRDLAELSAPGEQLPVAGPTSSITSTDRYKLPQSNSGNRAPTSIMLR